MFSRLVVRSPSLDADDVFRNLAAGAAEAGLTHLTYTEVPRSWWEWEDPDDPYLNWSVVHTSLFKVFPPEPLKAWVPAEYARSAQDSIARRAAVLKRYGVKGAVFLFDPWWWPEEVFEKHPALRGPRVDHPARSLTSRFAPCLARDEVAAMVADAFQKLAEISEGVLDLVAVRTNDSGTGFCWSDRLYAGPNGPSDCRALGAFGHMQRFLEAAREGVKSAGGNLAVYIGGGCSAEESRLLREALPPDCGYYAHQDLTAGGPTVLTGQRNDSSLFPVRGVVNVLEILTRLSDARERGFPQLIFFARPTMYGSDWEGEPLVMAAFAHFKAHPVKDVIGRIGLMRALAAGRYGDRVADKVASAWHAIHKAGEKLRCYDVGGPLLFLGSLAQRWLTRPLAAFPGELQAEESAHFRPFLFQVDKDAGLADPLNCQGQRQFGDRKYLTLFRRHFGSLRADYADARRTLAAAHQEQPHDELRQQVLGLETLDYFLANIEHTVTFHILREAVGGVSGTGLEGPAAEGKALKKARAELRAAFLAEQANSRALADHLEGAGSAAVVRASGHERPCAFLLEAELAGALRRKAEIMERRLPELDRL